MTFPQKIILFLLITHIPRRKSRFHHGKQLQADKITALYNKGIRKPSIIKEIIYSDGSLVDLRTIYNITRKERRFSEKQSSSKSTIREFLIKHREGNKDIEIISSDFTNNNIERSIMVLSKEFIKLEKVAFLCVDSTYKLKDMDYSVMC